MKTDELEAVCVRTSEVSFGFAVAPQLPPGVEILVIVRAGASMERIAPGLIAARGTLVSEGVPSSAADLARRWKGSPRHRIALGIEGGVEGAAPAAPKPARWETPDGTFSAEQAQMRAVGRAPQPVPQREPAAAPESEEPRRRVRHRDGDDQ